MITNAEYQRFLNERRASDYYHQPDHWHGPHFPPDQADRPVVGVRPADAVAFCDWLTQHEQGALRYRLPHREETNGLAEHSSAGYWVVTGDGYECVTGGLNRSVLTYTTLERWLEYDLIHAHAIAYDRDCTRIGELTSMLDLDLDFALTRIRSHAYARSIARDVDLDVAQRLASRNDQFINIALALDHQRASTIAHDLAREVTLTEKLIQLLNLDINNSIHRAIARDLARNLSYTLNTSAALNFHHTIDRTRSQTYGYNLNQTYDLTDVLREMLESAATREYGSGYTRCVNRAISLARTFSYALDCVLDRSSSADASPQRHELSDLLRWSARLSIFAVANELFAYIKAHKEPQRKSVAAGTGSQELSPAVKRAVESELRPLINMCLTLYADLSILEERIHGNLVAFEGIRVVQERT